MDLFSFVGGPHTLYLFIFSIGLSIGLGASVLRSALYFFAASDERISRDEFKLLKKARVIVYLGLLLYAVGGLGLFTLAYESMLALGIFYASMTIALILVANEIVLFLRHDSYLPKKSHTRVSVLEAPFFLSSVLAIASWFFLVLHHAMFRADIGYFLFMALYLGVVSFGIFISYLLRRKTLNKRNATLLIRAAMVTLILTLVCGSVWVMSGGPSSIADSLKMQSSSTGSDGGYTVEDVALHNNSEDCWLIIDGKVFNATEASRLHPALFRCGQDVSENYHKNHGSTIREQMMKFYIGELGQGKGVTNVDVPFTRHEVLNPYRELYVQEGSWSPRELMVVVEKDAEKLLFIDGVSHKEIGRIHDVGFQPHTSVYSSDAGLMYIVSRDGWLTKINLKTLQPIESVSVGENSRGTAITDNDKYVAVGNYAPGNLVILDAVSMKILRTVPMTGKINGKEVESRAGAVLEDGNRIIVALKDINSVWAIDTDLDGFPVTHKFADIGGNVPTLHDAFLTPNGKHYIVASQSSKTAWVLDLVTMKPVAEIETGQTPHTGPGAAWGKFIYIPSMGEGRITVINTETWKREASIETGGPGLFVRSYSKDPTYPYVWADTAFGDHKDEIYVIDARINKIVKTIIPVKGESSWHPEFTYNGKFVYVVSQSANEVEVYDAHTFALVKRIPSSTPSAISNIGIRIEEPGL